MKQVRHNMTNASEYALEVRKVKRPGKAHQAASKRATKLRAWKLPCNLEMLPRMTKGTDTEDSSFQFWHSLEHSM